VKKSLTLFSLFVFLCAALSAQEFRATISGHVLDSSGAAVPNAKVQATSADTNEVSTATTDNSGSYTIPLLRPGRYKLTATAQGFKQFVQPSLELEAAKVAGIDITLEVGAVTDTVEVTAEAALLETQTASRGGLVTTQQVAEMPLNARNPFMLGAMMSGVTFNGAAIWQRPFDNGAIAQWSINGSRDSSTEYFLDGASNNGQMGSNTLAYVPVVDAVQEFQVMQNLYNAEYGHTGGGILNVALKSGTNVFHGAAWEYMRRTGLDANTFQNNAVATNLDANGKAIRPTHYLDQYGFQVEGPLRIPGILRKDGPLKLFYLGTFENYREGTPNPLVLSYPTAEMRTGDFSKLTNNAGQLIPIYDPNTATYDASGNVLTPRQQFPGNVIPTNRLDPVALAVTKYMPLPNRAAPAGSRYATSNLFLPDYFDKDKFYNLILKFDMNIGSKDRAYFRHASNDRTEDRTDNGIDNKPGTSGQQPFQRINDAYVADWVRTVTPTLIVNVRGSYNRFIEKGYGAANAGFDMTNLGLSKGLIASLPYQDKIYFGRWNFYTGSSGSTVMYNTLGRSQSNNYTNTYELQGSMTKVAGSHTIKAGADIRQINYEQQNSGDILAYSGYQTWTQDTFTNANSNTGDAYASFLIGGVGGATNYPLFPWWKQHYGGIYVQDDWKATRKLTLNLGLRYDLNQPAYEKWNRMNGPFDPTVASPVKADPAALAALAASGVPASQIANLQNLKGGLTFAGVNGASRTESPMRLKNFGPRFGVAYQINEKTVLRTGFGLYYSNPTNDFFRTSGFSTSTNINNSDNSGRTLNPNLLSNPFPNGVNQPTGSSLGAATFVGQNPSWFDPNFVLPKVWSFSFGFQRQITQNSSVEVSYVGSRSYDLNMDQGYNIMSPDFEKQCDLYKGGSPLYCQQQVTNPFKGNPLFLGTSFYTANTVNRDQLARPFPQFNGDVHRYGLNDSWIKYNSLQVNYNLRLRSGLSILANYTLSKQMEQWGFLDQYSDTRQQGLYTLDRPHVLKLTTIYELPFGEGKALGANSNKFVKKLISGWQWTNFINDAFKGFPSDLPGNVIQLKDPQTPGPQFSGKPDWSAYQVRLWNPCVLKQNNDGSIAPTQSSINLGCGADFSNNWGNYVWLQTAPNYSPRFTPFRSGQIRRHHAMQMDASLLKTTKISERMRFQFGFEAFNLLNHNYFGRDQVNTTPDDSSGNFGSIFPSRVSTQNILPRQIQVRFKFNW
jgi:hypothetical protein